MPEQGGWGDIARVVPATPVHLHHTEAHDGDEKAGRDGVLVYPRAFPTYDAFARRLLEIRRAGSQPIVNLGK